MKGKITVEELGGEGKEKEEVMDPIKQKADFYRFRTGQR